MTFNDWAGAQGIEILPDDRSDVASLLAVLGGLSGDLVAEGRRGEDKMQLAIRIVDLPGYNAFAISLPAEDAVAIHFELAQSIAATARALASDLTFFPHWPSIKSIDPVRFAATPTDIANGSKKISVPPLADSKRQLLADLLSSMTLAFIHMHEVSHIYNGHTDWLNRHFRVSAISERPSKEIPLITGLERETLEWDADCSAIQYCLRHALKPSVTTIDGIDRWEINHSTTVSVEDAVKLVFTACLVNTFYFSSTDWTDPRDRKPRSHPHPFFRSHGVIYQIATVLNLRTKRDFTEAVQSLTSHLPQFINSWRGIFANAAPENYSAWLTSDNFQLSNERIGNWASTWSLMRPELDRYKRGGRLAPA